MKKLGKPQSSSDVVNKEPKVLLIGYGWVGQYMGQYFTKAHYVGADGVARKVEDNTEVKLGRYHLAIIGVPTPMNSETGQCDVSIVEEVVEKYRKNVDIFLVKSTVEIGTCERLEQKYQVSVCMSPEYVGETLGHPLLEPRRNAFQIIGGNRIAREAVSRMFMRVLTGNAPILLVTSKEAEIIKYCENMWIMRRVDYWNDVFEVCNVMGVSFTDVREGIVLDPRMSRTHSNVYSDNRGWSGKCLPKDMNALAYKMRQEGHPLPRLENAIKENVKRRIDIDSKEQLIPKPAEEPKRPFSGNRSL